MKTKVELHSPARIRKDHGLDPGGDVQRFWTATVLRRIQRYMPYRTGATIKLTIAQTDVNKPEIVTDVPYGKYLYYGYAMEGTPPMHVTDRPLKYTTTKNPLAGPKWDVRLSAAEGKTMAAELQAYIDRKR